VGKRVSAVLHVLVAMIGVIALTGWKFVSG
jgi:hypothetical protein